MGLLDIKGWDAKDTKAPPLQMLEDVGDFFAGFFGVIDGDVLALLGAEGGIAADGFAGIHGGMPGNFEGFLGAIGGFHGNGFRTLADDLDRAFGGMDGFIAEPLDGMGGLAGTFTGVVNDDMPAVFADKVGTLGAVLQAVHSGFLSELDGFDCAVSSFHGDSFCAGIDFLDRTDDDVSRILAAGHSESETGGEDHQDCPSLDLKRAGSHGSSLQCRRAGMSPSHYRVVQSSNTGRPESAESARPQRGKRK